MKIFINKENFRWILDQIRQDFSIFSQHQVIDTPDNADIIWALNPWDYQKYKNYECKKVLTLHHIDLFKINSYPFDEWGKVFDYIIVPNIHTYNDALKYFTNPKKHIEILPYWLRSDCTSEEFDSLEVSPCAEDSSNIILGSFQHDTEKDGRPKSAKAPQNLLEACLYLQRNCKNFRVILGGRNREFLRHNFATYGIKFEHVSYQDSISGLYKQCNAVIIGSDFEGGPQAILESSYYGKNIVSTNVGMASAILSSKCIIHKCNNIGEQLGSLLITNWNDQEILSINKKRSMEHHIKSGIIDKYSNFFSSIL